LSKPNHIAIIPDGNRRWAKSQRLDPWDGHTEGVKRFWDVADFAYEHGIKYVTFWGASYDNLKKRSKLEVAFLMKLLKDELLNPKIRQRFTETKTKLQVIGEWRDFVEDKNTVLEIERLVEESKQYSENTVTILFAYDGQREMLAAVNRLAQSGAEVTADTLRKELWTGELPDVDLVIRTGGEPHWSAGFMMWLTANSEFYFTETLWPAFDNDEIKKAIDLYDRRERKLGK
jgi:undecaprenyl diphosphate synthase